MRYQLITIYNDLTSKTEVQETIIPLLETAAIYLRDPDCEGVKIYDFQEKKIILDFWR